MVKLTLRVSRVEEDHFSGKTWGYHVYLELPLTKGVLQEGIDLATPIHLFCKTKAVADNFTLGSLVTLSIKTES